MRRELAALVVLACLVLSGCAPWPQLGAGELVPLSSTSAEELASGGWSADTGKYRLRLTGLYEYRGNKVPFTGIVEVDAGADKARLVGLTEMGLTLFDILVERGESRAAFIVEGLDRIPDFEGITGAAIRRIFLDPSPKAIDTLVTEKTFYILRSGDGAEQGEAYFAGDGRLLGKRSFTESPGWRVRYENYFKSDETHFPGAIEYRDRGDGLTLALRVETFRRIR